MIPPPLTPPPTTWQTALAEQSDRVSKLQQEQNYMNKILTDTFKTHRGTIKELQTTKRKITMLREDSAKLREELVTLQQTLQNTQTAVEKVSTDINQNSRHHIAICDYSTNVKYVRKNGKDDRQSRCKNVQRFQDEATYDRRRRAWQKACQHLRATRSRALKQFWVAQSQSGQIRATTKELRTDSILFPFCLDRIHNYAYNRPCLRWTSWPERGDFVPVGRDAKPGADGRQQH